MQGVMDGYCRGRAKVWEAYRIALRSGEKNLSGFSIPDSSAMNASICVLQTAKLCRHGMCGGGLWRKISVWIVGKCCNFGPIAVLYRRCFLHIRM